MTPDVPRLVEVRPQPDQRLRLRYDNGTEGEVDLSDDIAAGGVLAPLADEALFARVRLGEFGQVEWPGGVDLCADALYLRLVGTTPEDAFPDLNSQRADA